MRTEIKDKTHGKIFFTLGEISGELLLTHEQGEEFKSLVMETNIFSDDAIKDFLGIGGDVVLTVSGWTFSNG